jgi:hypothetical protein
VQTTQANLRLAPDVPDLAALGAHDVEDLLWDPPRVETAARLERVGSAWRVPLPGTVDRNGRQHERPRGAGTGYLFLHRYGGGVAALRARITHPRSSSLAARHWNLICRLQASGVTTPQLAALVERPGAVTSSASVLITRELEGFTTLRKWLESERDPAHRARGLESLSLALEAVLRCGAWLPRTSLDNLLLQTRDGDDCAALQITNLGTEQAILRERGLVRARLPSIAFTQFADGRLFEKLSNTRRERWMSALRAQTAPLLAPGEALAGTTE